MSRLAAGHRLALASPQTSCTASGRRARAAACRSGSSSMPARCSGQESRLQQLEQVAAAAAAHLEQAKLREVAEAARANRAKHRALPLLHRQQRRRTGEAG
jgi:hypothetical protein